MEFNWQSYCSECNNSCCKGENPFDTNKIIKSKENGDCEFLCGKCLSYETRPFECRIFPLDILDIDNELYWIVWTDCPATKDLNYLEMLKSVETLEDFNYVNKYVAYHKKNQPKKYNDMTYIVIKKYK